MCLIQDKFHHRIPRIALKNKTVYKVLYTNNPAYYKGCGIDFPEVPEVLAPFQPASYTLGELGKTKITKSYNFDLNRGVRKHGIEQGFHSIATLEDARLFIEWMVRNGQDINVPWKNPYYTNPSNTVFEFMPAIFECIIPAGSIYYEGEWSVPFSMDYSVSPPKYHYPKNIASNKLIIKGLVDA